MGIDLSANTNEVYFSWIERFSVSTCGSIYFFNLKYNLTLATMLLNQTNQVSYDHRSYERNLSNCAWMPEKPSTKQIDPL